MNNPAISLKQLTQTVFNYQKARGMLLASNYATNRFPFDCTLRIVRTEEEWNSVKDGYDENLAYRVDFPIHSTQNIAINTTGAKKDVVPLLHELREGSSEAALLLLKPTVEFVPRYAYDGGFTALFLPNQWVLLEIVGPGFDGRNTTSGQIICDSFRIPWDIARTAHNINSAALLNFQESSVAPGAYAQFRELRINELMNNDLSREFLESTIPKEYKWPEAETLDLIKNVVPRLIGQQSKIALEIGHELFSVQGNLVRSKAQVWEIFNPSRWA